MKHFILVFLLTAACSSFAQDTAMHIFAAIKDTVQQAEEVTEEVVDSVVAVAVTPTIDTSLTHSLEVKKKKFTIDNVRIMFGFDFSPYTPIATESDEYKGEYYPVKDSSPVFAERNTKSNLSNTYKVGNIGFFIQASVWKGLFVGAHYQFFTVRNYKKDPNLGNLLSKKSSTFFLVAANFGYAFEFLKNKCLQVQPSVHIGGYTADDYYDRGTGRKFYFGADCKVRYLIKRKAGFSFGVAYDFLRYKRKGYSDIFQRDTYQKTTFSNVSLNVGFCYNVTINTHKK